MRGRALLWAAASLLRATHASGGQQKCVRRNCLPPDSTQVPPVCYTETVSLAGLVTESFLACPSGYPYCAPCASDVGGGGADATNRQLPCESSCRGNKVAYKGFGEACTADGQCSGEFAKCLERVCRRSLHTFQQCSPDDPNDVCVMGRRSCFRGRCQGLDQGEACSGQPEGPDIDCNPGWYCFLGACTPQLPSGHTCLSQHPSECVRGYRCNEALEKPVCTRQYTLELGSPSSDATLCKTSHIQPVSAKCAPVPEIELLMGRPLVSGVDCTANSECKRSDLSLGECRCKSWWSGADSPSYCELFIQDSSRPTFKRFWENRLRRCHQDWTAELCAAETDLKDVLRTINEENAATLADPTAVADCAKEQISTEYLNLTRAHKAAERGATVRCTPLLVAAVALVGSAPPAPPG